MLQGLRPRTPGSLRVATSPTLTRQDKVATLQDPSAIAYRELRNKSVFCASAVLVFYACKQVFDLGLALALLSSIAAAIVCVVAVAMITNRFMD